jgi:fumarate hydratase subunit beta
LSDKDIKGLKAGDQVLLSGEIITARDQAHLRLTNMIKKGDKLPVDLKDQVVYYCGPTPACPEQVIGSCGPTTSGRMDSFAPLLLKKGIKGMIGKGRRSGEVRRSVKKGKAIYFVAPAGAGAYLQTRVVDCKILAFEDLGAEAIYKLKVKDFPVIVAIDSKGKSIYEDIDA